MYCLASSRHISAAFNFKDFCSPTTLLMAGYRHFALIISGHILPLYVWIIGVNIPFIALAYKIMRKQFAIKRPCY
ncbi:MAG: YitT family protein [Bacteroidetes bacterium]|nr:YitT family protein [Bacteroidota bacterium]